MSTTTLAAEDDARDTRRPGNRAFRGLFLVFTLTFLNLVGITLTAIGLNVMGDWTIWQFIGLFGIIEAGSGLANVVTPNLWAMPVVEQETSQRTKTVLALDTLLMPHWGGLARTGAGVVMIGAAGYEAGTGGATAWLLPMVLLVAMAQVGLSALIARGGVIGHAYDVVQVTLNWYREIRVPPISLSASALQFCLSIITIPAIAVLRPGAMYQPEIGPSAGALTWLAVATLIFCLAGFASWYPRIARHAPREQREEAEALA